MSKQTENRTLEYQLKSVQTQQHINKLDPLPPINILPISLKICPSSVSLITRPNLKMQLPNPKIIFCTRIRKLKAKGSPGYNCIKSSLSVAFYPQRKRSASRMGITSLTRNVFDPGI